MAWLPAKWADVSVGTNIRRDLGDDGEVMRIERQPHLNGYRLQIEVLTTEGQWHTLSVEPDNFVWVAVAAP
jgi:hypothetical protein